MNRPRLVEHPISSGTIKHVRIKTPMKRNHIKMVPSKERNIIVRHSYTYLLTLLCFICMGISVYVLYQRKHNKIQTKEEHERNIITFSDKVSQFERTYY